MASIAALVAVTLIFAGIQQKAARRTQNANAPATFRLAPNVHQHTQTNPLSEAEPPDRFVDQISATFPVPFSFAEAVSLAGQGPSPERSTPPAKLPVAAQPRNVRSNQQLANAVAEALRKARLKGFEIEIAVQSGVATLDGHVSSQEHREAAAKSSMAVIGITSVHNRLIVDEGAAGRPVGNDVDADSLLSAEQQAELDWEKALSEIPVSSRRKWEYKVVWSSLLDSNALHAMLNDLGAEGWELTSVRETWIGSVTVHYFKREANGNRETRHSE
jgi:hypothetical protein